MENEFRAAAEISTDRVVDHVRFLRAFNATRSAKFTVRFRDGDIVLFPTTRMVPATPVPRREGRERGYPSSPSERVSDPG